MSEGADVPPKKKTRAEDPSKPVPGSATNKTEDPLWVPALDVTVQPGETVSHPDITALPADLWETK